MPWCKGTGGRGGASRIGQWRGRRHPGHSQRSCGLVCGPARASVASRGQEREEHAGQPCRVAIEAGLLVYALGALLRAAFSIASATGATGAEDVIMDWGLISVSATLLVVFLAIRGDLLPIMRSLRRSERALSVVLGALTSETPTRATWT